MPDVAPAIVTEAFSARGQLTLDGISKKFGAIEVLRAISLRVKPGEFVSLLGPSGCGKTTLLRIIAGLEDADSGRVELDAVDLTHMPANQRPINTVFQSYALFPHLSVFDNVAFGLRARHIEPADVVRRCHQALELLHIGDLSARKPLQLSGGQQQRVALARALVNEPNVLLLDEPMSALDARLRAEVRRELRNLQKRLGTTFVLVTHDQEEALTVSDRILVMDHGRIVQEGTPREVYQCPATRFVAGFLGEANIVTGTRHQGLITTELGEFTPAREPVWIQGALMIRPECIIVHLAQTSGKNNLVHAAVTEIIFRGDVCDVVCAPGNLRVRLSSGDRPEHGERLTLELPAKHLHPLDD